MRAHLWTLLLPVLAACGGANDPAALSETKSGAECKDEAASCGEIAELRDVREIRLEETACYGSCPIFAFTVTSGGEGEYDGKGFVAVRGKRSFAATPRQFAAFARRLEPFRPRRKAVYDEETCDGRVLTDAPTVLVTWVGSDGTDELRWYLGCRQPGYAANAEALLDAWRELPVAELIGTRENRFEYEPDA
jgi:hypothetical protein